MSFVKVMVREPRLRQSRRSGLAWRERAAKRLFDIVGASLCLALTWWLMVLAYVAASLDTGQSGLFTQERIGRGGKPFRIFKIRTMRTRPGTETTVTCRNDPRITRLGRFLRDTKIDELPQLVNVLLGQMSLVGPRPDVPGFADKLEGADRIVLSVRPGITGPAALRYRDEERLLALQEDPERYNREVLFADKVRLNREYVETFSLWKDLSYLVRTFVR